MIDALTENVISLADAAKCLPTRRAGKRPHISCVYRWTVSGCKGVKLESIQIGGTRCTSREANNAGWDGSVMVFGDGDGLRFTDFTKSLDVIAHELGHAVTQYTSDLVYRNQSGALNESFSDVMGSLVKQWDQNQSVEDADWLIGQDVWTPGTNGDALRSMKSPGKAFVDHPLFGTDPQPDHMNKFVNTTQDFGGVHLNSGIPNKAFYETAVRIGGNAWEVSGPIWYAALQRAPQRASFREFALLTYEAAQPWGAEAARSVAEGWKEVGISVGVIGSAALRAGRRTEVPTGSLGEVMRQLAQISKRLDSLERTSAPRPRRKGA